jgi:hypothetical protein
MVGFRRDFLSLQRNFLAETKACILEHFTRATQATLQLENKLISALLIDAVSKSFSNRCLQQLW